MSGQGQGEGLGQWVGVVMGRAGLSQWFPTMPIKPALGLSLPVLCVCVLHSVCCARFSLSLSHSLTRTHLSCNHEHKNLLLHPLQPL